MYCVVVPNENNEVLCYNSWGGEAEEVWVSRDLPDCADVKET